jgi:hypothetical protein
VELSSRSAFRLREHPTSHQNHNIKAATCHGFHRGIEWPGNDHSRSLLQAPGIYQLVFLRVTLAHIALWWGYACRWHSLWNREDLPSRCQQRRRYCINAMSSARTSLLHMIGSNGSLGQQEQYSPSTHLRALITKDLLLKWSMHIGKHIAHPDICISEMTRE